MKLKSHYSGEASKPFWRKVNKYKADYDLYLSGVLLQEMEARVLGWVQQAEAEATAKRLRKGKP